MVQILYSAIMTGYKYTRNRQALHALSVAQWEEFKRLQEEQLTDLSVMLGRSTDIPYHEWFNILRSAQRLEKPRNGNSAIIPPPPPPPTPPEPEPEKVPDWVWFAGGAALLILIIGLKK